MGCDDGCSVAEDTCQIGGCPGVYCPALDGTITENYVDPSNGYNQSCRNRQCSATIAGPEFPAKPACGSWTTYQYDPCNNGKSCNLITRSGCNGGASSPICGGNGCCGKSPSCTGALIDFDLREQTGNAIREPIIPFHFTKLEVSSDCAVAGTSITCDWHDATTYKCRVSLPDGCPREGKLHILADIEGHETIDRLLEYHDQTAIGAGMRTAYAIDVPYTAIDNVAPGNYIRLNNASFSHRRPSASLTDLLPNAPAPFDALDFSPLTASNYAFSMGEGAGLITGINIGNNMQMKYSRGSNAHLTDYARTNFDIDGMVQRLLTQKKMISVATNPTITVSHGMIYRLPIAGGPSSFATFPNVNFAPSASPNHLGAVFLALRENATPGTYMLGNVTIDKNITNIEPIAIIADTINITANNGGGVNRVSQINAILIAKNIDTGMNTPAKSDNARLRVNGNLIVQNNFTHGRTLADTGRPSLLVDFNAQMYMQLLPLLSLYDELPYTEL